MSEIIVPGDPQASFTCITDRENPWHAWIRAALHIIQDKGWPYHERVEASVICSEISWEAMKLPRPGRIMPPRFSWKGIPGKL